MKKMLLQAIGNIHDTGVLIHVTTIFIGVEYSNGRF